MKYYFQSLIIILSFLNIEFAQAKCRGVEGSLKKSDFKVYYQVFVPKSEVRLNKAVIILPPTGGVNSIDRSYALRLCDRGIDTYILTNWSGLDEAAVDLGVHDRQYARGIDAIRVVSDSLNTKSIGLLGTSLGGLFASVAVGYIDKIDSVLVIAAGAPLASIIAYSKLEALVDLKNHRKQQFNYKTDAEYEAVLKASIALDPINQRFDLSHKSLGMIIATEDTIVPSRYQEMLYSFWNPEFVIRIQDDHKVAIVKAWFKHSSKIEQFFLNH
jgi:dienelactone hydrolase